MILVDLNQTWEIAFKENCHILNFSATGALYSCIKGSKNDLKL